MYGNYGNYFGQYIPNYYPNYQQPQQPQQQQQMMTAPQQQPVGNGDERIWVQGEVGAKAYLVAPNATVPLWDSERQRIFIKSVSAQGVPSMQCLTYSISASDTPTPLPVDNSFNDRLTKLEKQYEALEGQMKGMNRNGGNKPDRNDAKV